MNTVRCMRCGWINPVPTTQPKENAVADKAIDTVTALERIAGLHTAGALTDEEYGEIKQALIADLAPVPDLAGEAPGSDTPAPAEQIADVVAAVADPTPAVVEAAPEAAVVEAPAEPAAPAV